MVQGFIKSARSPKKILKGFHVIERCWGVIVRLSWKIWQERYNGGRCGDIVVL